jgi:hypothetical protein
MDMAYLPSPDFRATEVWTDGREVFVFGDTDTGICILHGKQIYFTGVPSTQSPFSVFVVISPRFPDRGFTPASG